MTGKLSLTDLLAKQRQLKKMIVHLRHYILKDNSWKGNCLSSGEVVNAAYRCPPLRGRVPVRGDAQLCIMLYAWMDRYYPRVRQHKTRMYWGSMSRNRNGIVWKVR